MPYTQITKVKAKYLHEKRGRFHPRSEVLGGNLQPKMIYAHAIADVYIFIHYWLFILPPSFLNVIE